MECKNYFWHCLQLSFKENTLITYSDTILKEVYLDILNKKGDAVLL